MDANICTPSSSPFRDDEPDDILDQLKKRFTSSRNDIAQLRARVLTLENENSRLKADVAALSMLKSAQVEAELLRRENEELKQRLKEREADLKDTEAFLYALTSGRRPAQNNIVDPIRPSALPSSKRVRSRSPGSLEPDEHTPKKFKLLSAAAAARSVPAEKVHYLDKAVEIYDQIQMEELEAALMTSSSSSLLSAKRTLVANQDNNDSPPAKRPRSEGANGGAKDVEVEENSSVGTEQASPSTSQVMPSVPPGISSATSTSTSTASSPSQATQPPHLMHRASPSLGDSFALNARHTGELPSTAGSKSCTNNLKSTPLSIVEKSDPPAVAKESTLITQLARSSSMPFVGNSRAEGSMEESELASPSFVNPAREDPRPQQQAANAEKLAASVLPAALPPTTITSSQFSPNATPPLSSARATLESESESSKKASAASSAAPTAVVSLGSSTNPPSSTLQTQLPRSSCSPTSDSVRALLSSAKGDQVSTVVQSQTQNAVRPASPVVAHAVGPGTLDMPTKAAPIAAVATSSAPLSEKSPMPSTQVQEVQAAGVPAANISFIPSTISSESPASSAMQVDQPAVVSIDNLAAPSSNALNPPSSSSSLAAPQKDRQPQTTTAPAVAFPSSASPSSVPVAPSSAAPSPEVAVSEDKQTAILAPAPSSAGTPTASYAGSFVSGTLQLSGTMGAATASKGSYSSRLTLVPARRAVKIEPIDIDLWNSNEQHTSQAITSVDGHLSSTIAARSPADALSNASAAPTAEASAGLGQSQPDNPPLNGTTSNGTGLKVASVAPSRSVSAATLPPAPFAKDHRAREVSGTVAITSDAISKTALSAGYSQVQNHSRGASVQVEKGSTVSSIRSRGQDSSEAAAAIISQAPVLAKASPNSPVSSAASAAISAPLSRSTSTPLISTDALKSTTDSCGESSAQPQSWPLSNGLIPQVYQGQTRASSNGSLSGAASAPSASSSDVQPISTSMYKADEAALPRPNSLPSATLAIQCSPSTSVSSSGHSQAPALGTTSQAQTTGDKATVSASQVQFRPSTRLAADSTASATMPAPDLPMKALPSAAFTTPTPATAAATASPKTIATPQSALVQAMISALVQGHPMQQQLPVNGSLQKALEATTHEVKGSTLSQPQAGSNSTPEETTSSSTVPGVAGAQTLEVCVSPAKTLSRIVPGATARAETFIRRAQSTRPSNSPFKRAVSTTISTVSLPLPTVNTSFLVNLQKQYLGDLSPLAISPQPHDFQIPRTFLRLAYGGSDQQWVQCIAAERNPSGPVVRRLVFPKEDLNPAMPTSPGESGLIFSSRHEILSDPPWSVFHKMVSTGKRKGPVVWKYLGEYKCVLSGPMDVDTFRMLTYEVKRQWAQALLDTKRFEVYVAMRARIALRLAGLLPIEDDVDGKVTQTLVKEEIKAVQRGDGRPVREEDIITAFTQGDEAIDIICLKCIKYDHIFADHMEEKLASYPAMLAKHNQTKARGEIKMKGGHGKGKKHVAVGQQLSRKRNTATAKSDDEDAGDGEELDHCGGPHDDFVMPGSHSGMHNDVETRGPILPRPRRSTRTDFPLLDLDSSDDYEW